MKIKTELWNSYFNDSFILKHQRDLTCCSLDFHSPVTILEVRQSSV